MSGNAPGTLEDLFIESQWLAKHLSDRNLRVVEVDVSGAAYAEGHIPGAVLWNAYTDLHRDAYRPIEPGEAQELLSRSGIAPDDTVVFYGYGRPLGAWFLKAYEHPRVLMLNASRTEWRDAALPWTTEPSAPTPTAYPLREPRGMLSLAEMQDAISAGDPVILDVRSEAEYTGERFWPSGATAGAGRPGHISGAAHLAIDQFHSADGGLRDAAELRSLLRERGVIPERRVVTYCTIGNRASDAALVLTRQLGFPNVSVYLGSWAEWGTRPETPIDA